MFLMNKLDHSFYKEDGDEKVIFPIAIPSRYKKMYRWLRDSYSGSDIVERVRCAIVKEIEEINKNAPKPFEDAG